MTVTLIRPEHVALAWPSLWPMLERAARRTPDLSEAEVRRVVDSGHAQLWAVLDHDAPIAAVTTQITLVPDKRCRLWLVGGLVGGSRMDEWAGDFLAAIEPWARAHGCGWIWGKGRSGWRRIAGLLGFEIMETDGAPGWGRRL